MPLVELTDLQITLLKSAVATRLIDPDNGDYSLAVVERVEREAAYLPILDALDHPVAPRLLATVSFTCVDDLPTKLAADLPVAAADVPEQPETPEESSGPLKAAEAPAETSAEPEPKSPVDAIWLDPKIAAIRSRFAKSKRAWANAYAPSDLVAALEDYAGGMSMGKACRVHCIPNGCSATMAMQYAEVIEGLKDPRTRDAARVEALVGLYNRPLAREADEQKAKREAPKPAPERQVTLTVPEEPATPPQPEAPPKAPAPIPHGPSPTWPYGNLKPWQVIEAIEGLAIGRHPVSIAKLENGLSEDDVKNIATGEAAVIAKITPLCGGARGVAIKEMKAAIMAKWAIKEDVAA